MDVVKPTYKTGALLTVLVYALLTSDNAKQGSKMAEEWEDRLKFERERWSDELALRREEHELKSRELARSGWRSPLVVAIAAAALAALGNGAISFFDARQQRVLEAQRTENQLALENRRAEAARILEVIKSGDATAVRNNLQFLIEAGLIESDDVSRRLANYLETTPDDQIPRLPQQISPNDAPSRKLHVLAVGIGEYQTVPSLFAPVGDAQAVVASSIQQKGNLYSDVSSFILTDSEATRSNIIRSVKDLNRRASGANGDVAFLYFSGHAHQDSEEFYLVPFDAELGGGIASLVSISELGELVSDLTDSTYVVLVIDACPSGNYRPLKSSLPEERLTLVVASVPGGICTDTAVDNHGALTFGLLEAFAGDGDHNGDGAITVSEFVNHILRRVPELTDGKQVPAASLGFDGIILTASRETTKPSVDDAATFR